MIAEASLVVTRLVVGCVAAILVVYGIAAFTFWRGWHAGRAALIREQQRDRGHVVAFPHRAPVLDIRGGIEVLHPTISPDLAADYEVFPKFEQELSARVSHLFDQDAPA